MIFKDKRELCKRREVSQRQQLELVNRNEHSQNCKKLANLPFQ